jgi:uncharacterized protein YegL
VVFFCQQHQPEGETEIKPGGFMSTVSLQSVFDFDKVSYEKDTEVHLDVVLTAPERLETKRIPLHLILAIDCSGSMDGGKLEKVKTTVDKLVDHLTENDSLGIIGFSGDVWEVLGALPMSKENKLLAKSKMKALRPLNMTNLSDALSMAMEKAVIADPTKTSRIILLTDGLPTTGVCDKDSLLKIASNANQKVSISTFGYGDDFDAELMASISKMGRGNNFYIKTDDECNKAFALELGGLLSLYGQNIKLTITPSGNMSFKEILSDYECKQKKGFRLLTPGKVEITIDDIFVGEKKHCILKLEIPKASEAVCARATRVCDVTAVYTDTENQKEVIVSEIVRINYVKADKIASEPNLEVKKQLLILETVRLQKEAKDKADAGQFKEAQNILGQACNFVSLNAKLIPNSGSYLSNLQGMSENFSDSYSYRARGLKQSTAFSYTLSKGRASSGDAMGMAYSCGTQENIMKSFMGNSSSAGIAPVSVGTIIDPSIIVITPTSTTGDPEPEKTV